MIRIPFSLTVTIYYYNECCLDGLASIKCRDKHRGGALVGILVYIALAKNVWGRTCALDPYLSS